MLSVFTIAFHALLCGFVFTENLLRLVFEQKEFRLLKACGSCCSGTSGSRSSGQAHVWDGEAGKCDAFSCLFWCLQSESARGQSCIAGRTDFPIAVSILSVFRLVSWCIIHIEHSMLVEPFSDKVYAEFVCDLLFGSAMLWLMVLACGGRLLLWVPLQVAALVCSFSLRSSFFERFESRPPSEEVGSWARWLIQPSVHLLFFCSSVFCAYVCCERAEMMKRRGKTGVQNREAEQESSHRGFMGGAVRERWKARVCFRSLVLMLDLVCLLRGVDVLYVLNSDALHFVLDAALTSLLLVVHFQKNVATFFGRAARQYIAQRDEEEIVTTREFGGELAALDDGLDEDEEEANTTKHPHASINSVRAKVVKTRDETRCIRC